jgi:hypothetical protein
MRFFDDFHLTFLPGFFTVSLITLPTVIVVLLRERLGFDAAYAGAEAAAQNDTAKTAAAIINERTLLKFRSISPLPF